MEFVTKDDFDTFKFNIQKILKAKGNKPQVQTRVLSDELTLKLFERRVQFIDPGGANRDVWLPHCSKLDGSPWLAPVECQNCECGGGHVYKEAFPQNNSFRVYNTADAEEDLVVKFAVRNYTTQTVYCNEEEEKTHDIPIMVDSDSYTVLTISQSKGGVMFCNGIIWKGFVGGIS